MARKKKKQSQGVYYLILFICAVCLAYEPVAKILSDARQKNSTPAKIELTAGTRLEIPAKLKNVSEQILQRKGYTVSYNKDLKIPNWVAWEDEHLIIPEDVEVYEINGPYFFGIATKFEEIMARLGDRPKVRIIRMRKVPFIDSTGIHNLTSLCEMSQKEKITIVLSGVNEKVHKVLEKSGFYELLGEENICPNINVALERAKMIIQH